MARIKSLPGLKVTILTGSENSPKQMEEYSTSAVRETTSTNPGFAKCEKYIMSTANEPYRIGIQVSENYIHSEHDLVARVFVDGKPVFTKTIKKSRPFSTTVFINGGYVKMENTDEDCDVDNEDDASEDYELGKGHGKKRKRAKCQHRKFQFTEIQFEDDDLFGNSDWIPAQRKNAYPDLALLGTIIVCIHKVDITHSYPVGNNAQGHEDFSNQKVDKRLACKDGPKDHRTKFRKGSLFPSGKRMAFKSKDTNKDGKPVGVFKFHYRSQENLIAMGILNEHEKPVDCASQTRSRVSSPELDEALIGSTESTNDDETQDIPQGEALGGNDESEMIVENKNDSEL